MNLYREFGVPKERAEAAELQDRVWMDEVEELDGDTYSPEHARLATIHARGDIVLLVSHMEGTHRAARKAVRRLNVVVVLLALVVVLLLGAPLAAQDSEPALRPLSEHLGQLEESPRGEFRYIARRCAALYSVIAATDDDASFMGDYVPAFLEMSTKVEINMGATAEEGLAATRRGVRDIAEVLRDRMRRNMAVSGNYFSEDPLLSGDLRTCRRVYETVQDTTP